MSDAFSGFKLSDAASTPRLPASKDQRLFAPSPVTAEKPASSPTPKSKPKRTPVVRVNGNVITEESDMSSVGEKVPFDAARSERPLSAPESKSAAPFDLSEKPYRKDSFLFTDSEFDRLDDLKLELRRRFDLPATKNDIARCALQVLFEDYMRDADKSRIVRHLRAKQR